MDILQYITFDNFLWLLSIGLILLILGALGFIASLLDHTPDYDWDDDFGKKPDNEG